MFWNLWDKENIEKVSEKVTLTLPPQFTVVHKVVPVNMLQHKCLCSFSQNSLVHSDPPTYGFLC